MSLLDEVRTVCGGQQSGSVGQLFEAATAMVGTGQSGGGLSALLQRFHAAGLGDLAKSWVSNGPNMPVSAEQIERALGSDAIQQTAQRAGLTPQQTSGGLAALLPHLVDHLTPNGAMPEPDMLQKALQSFKSKWMN
jgi:uncharacterized protein YidB (DUF937 family)